MEHYPFPLPDPPTVPAPATTHAPGAANDLFGGFGHRRSDTVEPFPAWAATGNGAVTSGSVYFQYLVADYSPTLTKMLYDNRGVASTGLTLARLGLYSVAGNLDLTLVARTASDTAIGNAANTEYVRSFDTAGGYPASYALTRGNMYALAFVLVGTTPGNAPQGGGGMTTAMASRGPLAKRYDGQSDLPASAGNASLAQVATWFYVAAQV